MIFEPDYHLPGKGAMAGVTLTAETNLASSLPRNPAVSHSPGIGGCRQSAPEAITFLTDGDVKCPAAAFLTGIYEAAAPSCCIGRPQSEVFPPAKSP